MGLKDKFESVKDETVGKVKEAAGKMTGDEKLKAEGMGQGLMGKAKGAVGEIKDKASDLAEDVAGKVNDAVDAVTKK